MIEEGLTAMLIYDKSHTVRYFKFVVYLSAVLLLVACSANNQIYDQSGSINTLRVNLGDTFDKRIENNKVEFRYCPDNTCLVFRGPIENENELSDFSLLYLFHSSSYIFLIKDMHGYGIFINNVTKEAESLLSKYMDGCEGDEFDIISCSLINLYEHGNFAVYNTRFDENAVHKDQVNVQESIDKKNLISIGSYRERIMKRKTNGE